MFNNIRNKHMYCKTQLILYVKMVSSSDVENGLIQDRSVPMIIIGSDVVSLYPSLRSKECGEEIYQAVVESDIKWEEVHWQEADPYIVMTRGYH